MESVGKYTVSNSNLVNSNVNARNQSQTQVRTVYRVTEKHYEFLYQLLFNKQQIYSLCNCTINDAGLLQYAKDVPTHKTLRSNGVMIEDEKRIAEIEADPMLNTSFQFSMRHGFSLIIEKESTNEILTITKKIYDPSIVVKTGVIFTSMINSVIEYALAHPAKEDNKIELRETKAILRAVIKSCYDSKTVPTMAYLLAASLPCSPRTIASMNWVQGDVEESIANLIRAGTAVSERTTNNGDLIFLITVFNGATDGWFDVHTRKRSEARQATTVVHSFVSPYTNTECE